jgi:hypothetical protein
LREDAKIYAKHGKELAEQLKKLEEDNFISRENDEVIITKKTS